MLSCVPQGDGTTIVTVVWSYYLKVRKSKYYEKLNREEAIEAAEEHERWILKRVTRNIISSEIIDENQAITLKYTEKMEKEL